MSSKDDLMERCDKQVLQLARLEHDTGEQVQLIKGDEQFRKMRQVHEAVGRSQAAMQVAHTLLREIGDWE